MRRYFVILAINVDDAEFIIGCVHFAIVERLLQHADFGNRLNKELD